MSFMGLLNDVTELNMTRYFNKAIPQHIIILIYYRSHTKNNGLERKKQKYVLLTRKNHKFYQKKIDFKNCTKFK